MSTGERITKDTERMNISVPRKIRRRMAKFQKDNYVNWSEIASQAFSEHIRENSKGKTK